MKVLLIGHGLSPDNMESHVIEGLHKLGHKCSLFNIQDVFSIHPRLDRYTRHACRVVVREPERLREGALLRMMRDYRPELVLVLLGNSVSPKTIAEIRKASRCPIVCWCQDAITSLGRQYLIGAQYDVVFVKDMYIVDFLARMVGHKYVHYLPEACSPSVHKRVSVEGDERPYYAADICTFGTLYYYRQAILEPLRRYRLKVWGQVPDWMVNTLGDAHMGRGVYEEEKCKAIGCSHIVLNTLHFAEIDGLNCRAFEVAGCGGFQLMSYSAAVSRHFEIGKEVEVFRTRDELLDKVDYYLERPETCRLIAEAGQRRAYMEHTYEKRLEELISVTFSEYRR